MRILYIQTHEHPTCRMKKAGAARYVRSRHWEFKSIDVGLNFVDVKSHLDDLKPDGCIVDASICPEWLKPSVFGGVPVVYLDCSPKLFGRTFKVCHDSFATGELAAKALLSQNLAQYAYIGYMFRAYWSDDRQRGFVKAVRKANRRVTIFRSHSKDVVESEGYGRRLSDFVGALKPGTGVFAANDEIATRVLSICRDKGINVPKDVVVIGVDNAEEMCSNTSPSLTSIQLDFERGGYNAAELLSSRLQNRKLKPRTLGFEALGVVHRRSTGNCGHVDPQVVAAVEYVRENACAGIGVPDVVSMMGCGRRMAELRFRKMTGKSIFEEIQVVRFERVFVVLKSGVSDLRTIADVCGFPSGETFRKEFRLRTRLSVREWRKKYL